MRTWLHRQRDERESERRRKKQNKQYPQPNEWAGLDMQKNKTDRESDRSTIRYRDECGGQRTGESHDRGQREKLSMQDEIAVVHPMFDPPFHVYSLHSCIVFVFILLCLFLFHFFSFFSCAPLSLSLSFMVNMTQSGWTRC